MSNKRPSTLEILKLLEGSNCGECRLPTCMAFAALVYQGQRKLAECSRLKPADAHRLAENLSPESTADWNGIDAMQILQARFEGLDLTTRAERLGGWMCGDRLAFHCLGRVFELDPKGGLHSQSHVNPWLHVPMLSYVLDGRGADPTGDWVRFEELERGKSWIRFFQHACEAVLGRLADADPDLLLDILNLFAAQRELPGFEAKHSFLLRPLPKLPFVFAFQPADEDFPAAMAVYLDRTADRNLDPESIFRLGNGMAEMFRRIALRHGCEI